MFGLQFVSDMETLQREMDQIFRGVGFSPVYSPQAQAVAMNVEDVGESYLVEASLPGLDTEKLDINLLGRKLTVSGEFVKHEAPGVVRFHRQERQSGKFEQNLHLPADLDSEKIAAEYKNGLLKITLPKAATALPKKITVKAA